MMRDSNQTHRCMPKKTNNHLKQSAPTISSRGQRVGCRRNDFDQGEIATVIQLNQSISATWGAPGQHGDRTRMSNGKTTKRWRECDAAGNVLLGDPGSGHSRGHSLCSV
ncbi:hypothetical protein DPEC_G00262570 [Dallia pectoralis]|uniref:Uncharacterized protein n=1 Tax=Dallia pectoralis TaxID=75939 RepID=A0ACC2FS91_DALPE|nr:hypothetical protein DPEC_G00262570 [Dallia pectoralis]